MAKLRMNDEYRKKILNRYIEHAEQEETQERQAYLDVKADIHDLYQEHILKKMWKLVEHSRKNMAHH